MAANKAAKIIAQLPKKINVRSLAPPIIGKEITSQRAAYSNHAWSSGTTCENCNLRKALYFCFIQSNSLGVQAKINMRY